METYNRSMQVEVRVHGDRIAQVLGQAKPVGQKHEGARECVVEVTVSLPEVTEVDVLGPVVGLRPVDVLQDLGEDMADHDGAGEGRIRGAFEYLWEVGGGFFAVMVEGFLGCRKKSGYLLGGEHLGLSW
jgi:hypothetical protein